MNRVEQEIAIAFGVVARCRRRVAPARVQALVKEFAFAHCPGATVAETEEIDWGSLVSPRPELFHFVQVVGPRAVFSLCRFREVKGGFEFLFNLSNTGENPHVIERFLLKNLPVEIVKREFF